MQRVFRRIIVVCALGNLALFTFVVAAGGFLAESKAFRITSV